MLFMLIVKASKNSEAGNLPSPELMDAMTKYNEELVKAGVRIMAEGLHPSSNGIRISYPKPGGKTMKKAPTESRCLMHKLSVIVFQAKNPQY